MRLNRWPTLLALALPLAAQDPGPDIEGIRLGMPLKEAMTALKAHNPNLKLVPDSFRYPGLPEALTYGINAVGAGEGFYFLLTMPPSPVTVSKLTWVMHYGENSIPTQDVVVANLVRKYGPISYDTTPAALSLGTRDVFWMDDAQGNRSKGAPVSRCLGQSTFFMNSLIRGTRQYDPVSVRLPPLSAKQRIEEGFVNPGDPMAEQCAQQSMVHARLFRTRVMGIAVPNLVEYVVLMIASGPLDQKATKATHEFWRAKNAK